MTERSNSAWIAGLCASALFAAGLVTWWPLAALGVIIAALYSRFVLSLVFGIVLDIVYGAPAGLPRVIIMPFFLLALISVAVWWCVSYYFSAGERRLRL